MEQEHEEVSLRNLAGGAAIERFDDELARVIENIMDPNMEPGVVRKITLEVSLKPQHDRTGSAVGIICKSTLAPKAAFPTQVFHGLTKEGPKVYESNPRQMSFNDFERMPEATEHQLRVATLKGAANA